MTMKIDYRIAACAVLTAALAGCGSSTSQAVVTATTREAASATPVPAYVARLKADGYTPAGSCALHGAQGVGQAWGNDNLGNGEMLMEAKTPDFVATLAATMNAFITAAGSTDAFTVVTVGNYVVITGPADSIDNLGKAGC